MIYAHLTGVLAWFWHPISNGTARGYRNFGNFRCAILFHCGKLDLIPR